MSRWLRAFVVAATFLSPLANAFADVPPPVPALPDAPRFTTYSISGTTCACAVNFALYGDSTDYQNWIEVWLNGTKVAYNDATRGWSLSSASGSFATLARPITNAVLTFNSAQTGTVQIIGARDPRRVSQYTEGRGVAARDLNRDITDVVAMLRENWDLRSRMYLAPPGMVGGVIPGQAITASAPIVYNQTSGLISCPTCATTTPSTSALFVSSRTTAAVLDLTTFGVVRTGGYAGPADGGGATFKNVGSAAFKDSYITSATLSGGSGYTTGTGTYLGVRLTGGTGLGCTSKVSVAAGVITAIDISGTLCPGYLVGDVLSPLPADMGGTGSGATYTVTGMSTPTGSFTDLVGNHIQIVTDAEGFPNVRQFGAKLDWNGVDASATNDILAFRSAISFAMYPFASASAIVNGSTLIVPKGAAYLCSADSPFSTLIVPQGIVLRGAGVNGGTSIKQCAGENSSSHFVTLCDPNAQFGQFGCGLEYISVLADGASSNGIAAIYSNSGQQFPLLNHVYIQPGLRQCIKYEIGKGGASNAIFNSIDCEQNSATTNVGAFVNSSNTQIVLRDVVFGCAPGICGSSAYAVSNGSSASGNLILENFHIESHVAAINMAGTDLSTIRNGTITSDCTNGITLQSTNANNSVLVENIQSACTATTVLNGHASGSNVTGSILAQRVFNP